VLDSPGSQIGLRYGRTVDLAVRYVRDDPKQEPVSGEPVHFAIFDDPVGSTLTHDVVSTDDDGLATVTLTAGSQEGAFRVRASAGGAADVELAISISELEFVQMDALLTDPLPSPGSRTLIAALYSDRDCAAIPPTPKGTGASRTLVASSVASTTLGFVNLLSRTYAVVGRVEEAGRLVAFGCLDVDRALIPPGAHLKIPLALRPVRPSVVGEFTLDTTLGTSRAARTDDLFADIDILDRCEGHLGQLLLDELVTRVTPLRATQVAAHRGATVPSTVGSSTVSCRPSKLAAADTLDVELGALVSAAGSPGEARALLLADLDALMQSAHLHSTLALTATTPPLTDGPSAPNRFAVSHQAATVSFTLAAATRIDTLATLALPSLGAVDVPASASANLLTIDEHALPIRLSSLWGTAFDSLSIEVRLPSLADATLAGWVTASALAASRSSMSGCAAIEDLVCQKTGPSGCAGTLLVPCANAVTAVAARVAAPFSAELPLELHGTATITDIDGDLIADRFDAGQWVTSGAIGADLSWSGARTVP